MMHDRYVGRPALSSLLIAGVLTIAPLGLLVGGGWYSLIQVFCLFLGGRWG